MTTKAQRLAKLLESKGISNEVVLAAIGNVPRYQFVPAQFQDLAYQDHALPIGEGQTISQPFVVARMTELILGAKQHLHRVLEIGTGSGYQAAVLANLADQVYTIERIASFYQTAKNRLQNIGYLNVHCLHGDGYSGWPEQAPYDAIIVTAAAPQIPEVLKQQLGEAGRMIIPVGEQGATQQLTLVTRHKQEFTVEILDPVVFVPMLHGKTD